MNWKYILPYWKVTYVSELSKEEILRRVADETEPKNIKVGSLNGYVKNYQGKVYENQFKLRSIISYQNSFRPWAIGKVITNKSKTIIHITFKSPTWIVVLFTLFTVFMVCLTAFAPIFDLNLFPFLGLVVGITVGFHLEAHRLKNKLKTIL